MRTGTWTKYAVEMLFELGGMGWMLQAMKDAAAEFEKSLNQAVGVRDASRGVDASSSKYGGVIIGFGMARTGGLLIGATGAAGFFVTTDGDIGVYGSVSIEGGLPEISQGPVFSVFWGSGGASGLQCFAGNNYFISVDLGEVLAVGVTVAWPLNSEYGGISNTPCGIAIAPGVAYGVPFDLFNGDSKTWLTGAPPSIESHISSSNLVWQGDVSYWSQGLTIYWFNTYEDAMGYQNGQPNWSTGANSFASGQLSQNGASLTGMQSGWLAVSAARRWPLARRRAGHYS